MKCRAEVKERFSEINLVGRSLGPYAEGEEVLLRPWEISILREEGLVEPVEDFSTVGIRKRLMSERKSSQLEDLSSGFYQMVEMRITELLDKGENEEVENMRDVLNSLINLRVQKIAKIVASSISPKDMPPMEMLLVNKLSKSLAAWKERLGRILDRSEKEEVGAPDREIRRSIQRIVGDTTDI
ncbi:MAG: hypothetical protein ACLFUR_00815 [Candidatus Hadarchaeia archaeon]